MRKIIAISSVLTVVASSSLHASSSLLTNKVTPLQQSFNQNQEEFRYLESFFSNKSDHEKDLLKQDLRSAISVEENGLVTLNNNQLNHKMWDTEIYNIITSQQYLATLNYFEQNKIDVFAESNKATVDINIKQQNSIHSGLWAESYWYWFGYWRLHFSSLDIERLAVAGHSVGDFTQQIIVAFPPAAPIAAAVSAILASYGFILAANDSGRGAWLGFYLISPIPFDFGSN